MCLTSTGLGPTQARQSVRFAFLLQVHGHQALRGSEILRSLRNPDTLGEEGGPRAGRWDWVGAGSCSWQSRTHCGFPRLTLSSSSVCRCLPAGSATSWVCHGE